MFWPSAQDYNEAVQNPTISFADPELRAGSIDVNRLGLPKVMSGAFASVYKVNSANAPWAVRCFLNCREDQQERYKAISDFVLFDDLDCTVPFYYLQQGIKVKGNWYPILKMEWVEGITLEKFLDDNFKNARAVVDLLKQFDDMILDLARAGIAHGDLQHGNIIVTAQGLRLVDYDALYVPALDGWQSPEVGHPSFQHPLRSATQYNPGVDNFSAWLIHFSLLAISIDPELYRLVEGGDDCILFKRGDLRDPRRSELFKILVEHPATELRQAGLLLASMLAVQPQAVPSLGASAQDLSGLPDVSRAFQRAGPEQSDELFDAGELGPPTEESVTSIKSGESLGGLQAHGSDELRTLQELSQTGSFFDGARYSAVLPQNIRLKVTTSTDENSLIIRESYCEPHNIYSKTSFDVQLAIINRNVANKLRTAWDRWYLRHRPRDWCRARLKRATRYFEKGDYHSATGLYLELADVLEFLTTNKDFWKRFFKAGQFAGKVLILYCLLVAFLFMVVTTSPTEFVANIRIFCLLVLLIVFLPKQISERIKVTVRKLKALSKKMDFNPQRTLVEVQLSLGYCFVFNSQSKVASNYFMMAVRNCKWGIDPDLRQRALLMYALCRNESGDRKETIRFLLQKQEVIERLPKLVDADLKDLSFTKRESTLKLFLDLGQIYFQRKLMSSTLPPLHAAKKIYQVIEGADSAEMQALGRELFLMLAFIYTLRGDWTASQNNFNALMEVCSLSGTDAPEHLRQAQLCAALASNLKGDLTGATSLIMRIKFPQGELLAQLANADSVAHKILHYDKARGISFLLEVAGKLKESDRREQLQEYCSALMAIYRSNKTPSPLFAINWLDDLDEDFISECLRRSYFSGREPNAAELTVLINALIDLGLHKTLLVLSQMILKDNRLDTLDYLFNRIAANNQLNKIVILEEKSTSEKLDRLFADLILRISNSEFAEKLSALIGGTGERPVVERSSDRLDEQVESVETKNLPTVKEIVNLMLQSKGSAVQSTSDIIYGAVSTPSFIQDEFMRYRGVLRFIELCLAKQLASENLSEESLLLYDKLEGYYSSNIDRILELAAGRVVDSKEINESWLRNVIGTSHLAYQYRGESGNQHLAQIKDRVAEVTRQHCERSDKLSAWQEIVLKVDGYEKASFSILDTICATACAELKGRGNRSSLVEFIIAIAYVYELHENSKQASEALARISESEVGLNETQLLRCRLAQALSLKMQMELDAAGRLAGVFDARAVLREAMNEDSVVSHLVRHCNTKSVELFLEAGDVARGKGDDKARARYFYLAAACVYNSIALTTSSRTLAMKLAERLGEGAHGKSVAAELDVCRADCYVENGKYEEALSIYLEQQGRTSAQIDRVLDIVVQNFTSKKKVDEEFFESAERSLNMLQYYRGSLHNERVQIVLKYIGVSVVHHVMQSKHSEKFNQTLKKVFTNRGRIAAQILNSINQAVRELIPSAPSDQGQLQDKTIEAALRIVAVTEALIDLDDSVRPLRKPASVSSTEKSKKRQKRSQRIGPN